MFGEIFEIYIPFSLCSSLNYPFNNIYIQFLLHTKNTKTVTLRTINNKESAQPYWGLKATSIVITVSDYARTQVLFTHKTSLFFLAHCDTSQEYM